LSPPSADGNSAIGGRKAQQRCYLFFFFAAGRFFAAGFLAAFLAMLVPFALV
jgi:hypothetical protein